MRIPFLERKRNVTWADEVAKRRSPIKQKAQYSRNESENNSTDENERYKEGRRMRKRKPEEIIEKRTKKTAAIAITTRGEITNKEIMLRAKKEIKLKELEIENCQIRSGFTGGLIIEITGENAERKADNLAIKLRKIFDNEQVRVNRPKIKADIKIFGLDETTTNEDIQETMSINGECEMEEIRIKARRTTVRENGIA